MYKYVVLCLVVLCGCSKSAPVGINPKQVQDASMPQIAASRDAGALPETETASSDWYEPVFEYEYNYEPFSEEEIERLTLILYGTNEDYLKGWSTEILFIYKVNLGIPGGGNYIVLWTTEVKQMDRTIKDIRLYSISDKIESRYSIIISDSYFKEGTNFDIMKNIPGFHIGFDTGASVYDFNGDGIDELFLYGFGGMVDSVKILGYDAEKNRIVNYCDGVIFSIIDKDKGPAPVEFTRYKGRNGFKLFQEYEPRFPPVNLIDNYYAWYFYSWNDETKQYENIGEYLPDETDAKYNIHAYSLEHFKNRIRAEYIEGGMEGLVDLVEIKANIEGGRSFNATIYEGSTKITKERIINFNSDGRLVWPWQ
jgi:hypothetical protein